MSFQPFNISGHLYHLLWFKMKALTKGIMFTSAHAKIMRYGITYLTIGGTISLAVV